MSVARQLKRSQKRSAEQKNSTAILATGLHENDKMRVGMTVSPRKVIVTERESIKRTFAAPRLDMGEYVPVSTHAAEMDKQAKGWTA